MSMLWRGSRGLSTDSSGQCLRATEPCEHCKPRALSVWFQLRNRVTMRMVPFLILTCRDALLTLVLC